MAIMVTKSSLPSIEEYINEIRPIFEEHRLTNMGPVYRNFQHQLIDYMNVPYLSLFVNGHMALEIALQATDLVKPGAEVITTPYTFVSTTHAITRCGLRPVFCDIRWEDYTIDPSQIESLITENTVAILPVHVYGNLCDVEAIQKIADRHHLKVIYDAAHAFGESYRGVGVGNFGDMTMFSFHATKVFNTIEGGAVTFRDAAYRTKLHELKNFGIHSEDDVLGIGCNAKMNEFCAAMGICNLRHIQEAMESRFIVHERYMQNLSGVPGLILHKKQPDVSCNYSYFPVYFDPEVFGRDRDTVCMQLRRNEVFSRKYFYPAVNELSCYKNVFVQNTPVAHDVSTHILTLPIYEGLTIEEVDRICDVILRHR